MGSRVRFFPRLRGEGLPRPGSAMRRGERVWALVVTMGAGGPMIELEERECVPIILAVAALVSLAATRIRRSISRRIAPAPSRTAMLTIPSATHRTTSGSAAKSRVTTRRSAFRLDDLGAGARDPLHRTKASHHHRSTLTARRRRQ
jgi:hypothetical protein